MKEQTIQRIARIAYAAFLFLGLLFAPLPAGARAWRIPVRILWTPILPVPFPVAFPIMIPNA